MDKNLFDDIIRTLITLLDQVQAGFMFDPELDFASMKATTDMSQADSKLYEKTGKRIAIQRVQKPIRLVIFLDINCNVHIAFQQRELTALLLQIIDHMAKDIIIEVRDKNNQNISIDWQQIISGYTQKQYESAINDIFLYAKQESQEGNLVLIVSDFFDVQLSGADLSDLRIVYLQIQLPIVSSYFHHFYINPPKKLDVDNWFVV